MPGVRDDRVREATIEERLADLEASFAALEALTHRGLYRILIRLAQYRPPEPMPESIDTHVDDLQRRMMIEALTKAKGCIKEAARLSGMTERRFSRLKASLKVPVRPWEDGGESR